MMQDPVELCGGPFDETVIERPNGQYIILPLKLYIKEQTWVLNVLVTYHYTSVHQAHFSGVRVAGKGGFSWVPDYLECCAKVAADVNAKETSDAQS